MKILFENINGDPWRHLNGVDTTGQNLFVHEISQSLVERGHTIDVVTRATEMSDKPVYTLTDGLRIFRIPAGTLTYTYRDNVSSVLEEYTQRLIQLLTETTLRYDIVHGNYWMSAPICRSVKDLGYANKLVFTPHSSGRLKAKSVGISNSMRDKIEMEIFLLADGVHVLSDDEAISIQEFYTTPQCVGKIPHGVNKKVFYYVPQKIAREKMGWSYEKRFLLFVGRFESQKNLPLVLRIYERFQDEINYANLQLVICGGTTFGTPSEKDLPFEINNVMKSVRHCERIQFMGRIQNDSLRWFYAASDVLLMPSLYEPFGLVAAECVTCGTPVAAFATGGLKETIQSGINGNLTPVGDEEEFFQSVKCLLHPSWRDEQRRETVIASSTSRLSWNRAAEEIENFYQELLGDK